MLIGGKGIIKFRHLFESQEFQVVDTEERAGDGEPAKKVDYY